MFFEEITIHNMFSYRHETFDFRKPKNQNGNVVLVSGRNGFGKTSFLNSIKLLFHGPTDEILSNAEGKKDFSLKQYVIGYGSLWMGILNQNALREKDTTCWVEIKWREKEGTVVARRTWDLKNARSEDVIGTLEVHYSFGDDGLKRTSATEAQDFIDGRLPREFMPFFFFDGEQISRLAVTESEKQSQYIEQILAMDHVDKMLVVSRRVVANMRKEALSDEVYEELVAKEAEYKNLQRWYRSIDQKKKAKERLIVEIKEELKDLERGKDRIFNRIKGSAPRDFDREKRDIAEKKSRAVERLISVVPELPLLANPDLVQRCSEDLNAIDQDENSEQHELLCELKESLPRAVFDERPFPKVQDEDIRDFYKKKLIREVCTRIDGFSDLDESIFRIHRGRARTLLLFLNQYLDNPQRVEYATQTLEILKMCPAELKEIEQERIEHRTVGDVDAGALAQIDDQIAQLNKKLGVEEGAYEELKQPGRKKKLKTDMNKLKKEIDELKAMIEEDVKLQDKLRMAEDLASFLRKYKVKLKERVGRSLEGAINRNFKEIMKSHRQIKKIEFDTGSFTWSYRGDQDVMIGKMSISAGMKQLVATSIIWALQKVSGREIPIVIDTPLARIDLNHQETLLERYYPEAGSQVIILPTDSEIDMNKYEKLKPNIYLEYSLKNDTGTCSEVKSEPMYHTKGGRS